MFPEQVYGRLASLGGVLESRFWESHSVCRFLPTFPFTGSLCLCCLRIVFLVFRFDSRVVPHWFASLAYLPSQLDQDAMVYFEPGDVNMGFGAREEVLTVVPERLGDME